MAYIPKNQYSVKYTNGGEFKFRSTGKNYKGYYLKTIKNKYYAGNDPQLIKGELIKNESNYSNTILSGKNNRVYNALQKPQFKKQSRNQPIPSSTPFPTPEDYQRGFFKRYLSYKRNTKTFKEINKETYDRLLKGQGYDNNLYQAIEIKWVITENASLPNINNLRYYQTKYPGIIDFFSDPNQYTAQAGIIRLSEGVRIYPDGNAIPKALPAVYQKGNQSVNTIENPKVPKYQHCKNCVFFKQNYCTKWEAAADQTYWCAAYNGVAGNGSDREISPEPQVVSPSNSQPSQVNYRPGY
jgi:hypothetical protein